MRKLICVFGLALLATAVSAQTKYSLVFTGRFDSFSLDPNGGSLNRIREFDLGITTPGPGCAAKSWLPTTGFTAMLGDSHNDGNYTRFHGLKTTFGRFNHAGPFVKHADRAKGDPKLIFFTIRDNGVNQKFEVFINGGTKTHQMRPGDFVRFLPNGNAEFFITQDLIMKAAGLQTGSFKPGAAAVCQDANGDLYFSPAEGGCFIAGVFMYDGAIFRIEAKDITYGPTGNVQDVKAGSAMRVIDETANGTPTIRNLVANAGANTYSGTPFTVTANMVALEIDPNGGRLISPFNHPVTQKPFSVPNMIFSFDNGTLGGTIFSTAPNSLSMPGSIAKINGVTMGTKTGSADGIWGGFKQDKSIYSPTYMGFCLVHEVKNVFTADALNDGAILSAATKIEIDLGYMPAGLPTYMFMTKGAIGNGKWHMGWDMTPLFAGDSFGWVYVASPPVFIFPSGNSSAQGYARFSVTKPVDPLFIGVNLMFQGAKLNRIPPLVSLSNPVVLQFK